MAEEKWKINERLCAQYLNKNFGTASVRFEQRGESDSTESDILIIKNNIKACYIEAKMEKAQCGQFVLFPNEENRTFEYSSRNHPNEPSNQATEIIAEMNRNFDKYHVPSGNNDLDMDKNLFYDWIINHYSQHEVEYFIVSTGKEFLIFPIRNFDKYFDVSAKYRIKKSGSSDPARRDYIEIENFFKNYDSTTKSKNISKKFFIQSCQAEDKAIYLINGNDYQIKVDHDNWFRVTRLSHTFNANVIFSISLKKKYQETSDLDEFKIYLQR